MHLVRRARRQLFRPTPFELYGCDADPSRHAFHRGWKSLSRMTNQPLTLPVVHQAPPNRLHAPTGGCCDAPSHPPLAEPDETPFRASLAGDARQRVDLTNLNVSSPTRLGAGASTLGAPSVVSCRYHLRSRWMLVADSTPQANIAHPFASFSPSVRVNGAMGSFVVPDPPKRARTNEARGPCSIALRRRMTSPRRCVRPTDAIHTISTSTRVSFGDRPHRACARGFGVWRAFTALLTLRQPARAPCRGCSPPRW